MQCVLPGTSSPALIASGDEFHLGQSPPHWFGQFVNNATRVSIQPALTRNAPLFLYQSADRYPYHALPYRLYQSGALVAGGQLPAASGSWDPQERTDIPLTSSGVYSLEVTYDQYWIEGDAGLARVVAEFNTALADKNPPTLLALNVLQNGEMTSRALPGTVTDVSFRVTDSSGLSQVSLAYRTDGDWIALALDHEGDGYAAQLPGLADGQRVSLRITARDAAGNSLMYEVTPALSVGATLPTPTPTNTPSPTPSPTPTPTLVPHTVTLQQGSGGYAGAEDTHIGQDTPDSNCCDSQTLYIGVAEESALLRFDVSSIPPQATIHQARLEVFATSWWISPVMQIDAFRVLRGTDLCQATWNLAQTGNPWAIAGCNGPGSDRGADAESSTSTSGASRWYTFDLTALVQDWVDGAVANNGVLLRLGSPVESTRYGFASAEYGDVGLRPRLVITYAPPSCVPTLISPEPGAVMDNGRTDGKDLIVWDFAWSGCAWANAYNLYVIGPSATRPVINAVTTQLTYHDESTGYITRRFNWMWKVRARVGDTWGPWSEERLFDVEPADSDPPYTPTPTRTATATRTATQTRTATATPTPLPEEEDTYIYQWTPDSNYCSEGTLKIGYRQQYAALLRFDLSYIPANATITYARLELWVTGGSGSNVDIAAYRVLRDTHHCQVTWNQARAGQAWGLPGCNQPLTDRGQDPETTTRTSGVNTPLSFPLTALVQDWVSGELENNGLLLRGASALSPSLFEVASLQHSNQNARPRLVVHYEMPAGPTVTRTPTPTQVPTPMPTKTHTRTPTPTHSPSFPTFTLTPSRTLTATPSPTATTPLAEGTITLQQGLNGYTGGRDTYLYQWASDANYCGQSSVRVGYKQQYGSLLYFDLSPVPAGAQVLAAQLEVYAVGWGGSDMTIGAYPVLRNWQHCEATWNRAQISAPWAVPGCNGAGSDRAGTSHDIVTTSGTNKWYSFGLTDLVQGWVAGTAANHGLLLRGESSWSTSQFYFASAEDSRQALRPKLVVTYQTALGTATPTDTVTPVYTPTRTPTASATPTVSPTATKTGTPTETATPGCTPTVTLTPTITETPQHTPTRTATVPPVEGTIVLQQGLDGYDGCQDTYMYQWAPDANYCRQVSLRVGYKQQHGALLRFNTSSVPAGAEVLAARLEVYAVGWGGSNMSMGAYRVLRDWQDCEATWNRARSGAPWAQPGCNGIGGDRAGAVESTVNTQGINRWYSFDMAELVQGWVDGSVANYGIVLRGESSWSTSQFYLASAEAGGGLQPRLVVAYRLTGGASGAAASKWAPTWPRPPTLRHLPESW